MGGVCEGKVAGWAHTSLAMGKGGEAAPSKSIGVAEAEGTGMGGVSGQGADHASRHQMGGKLPEHKKKMDGDALVEDVFADVENKENPGLNRIAMSGQDRHDRQLSGDNGELVVGYFM